MALRPVLIHENRNYVGGKGDTHIGPHCLARKFVGKKLLTETQFLARRCAFRQAKAAPYIWSPLRLTSNRNRQKHVATVAMFLEEN